MLQLIALLAGLVCVSAEHVLFTTGEARSDCVSYHGRYGGQSVYRGTLDCLASSTTFMNFERMTRLDDVHLIHAQPAAIEGLAMSDAWTEELNALLVRPASSSGGQTILTPPVQLAEVVHVHSAGVFLSVPRALFQEALLQLDRSPYTVLRLVPDYALPTSGVSLHDRQRIGDYLHNLTFDPEISHIVKTAFSDERSLHRDATWLSGERSALRSRHSFTADYVKAAEWVKEQAEGDGGEYAPECELYRFAPGFGPNVICRYPSSPNATNVVVMASHLDSRGSWGYARAGGGDDDGCVKP